METRFYKSKTDLVSAAREDKAILRALEEERASRERRPSRWRRKTDAVGIEGQPGYAPEKPEGVYPSSFHGRAVGSPPHQHVATSREEVKEGSDGLFYYRVLEEELDKDGAVIVRDDLPSEVEVDGVTVLIDEDGGVEMVEGDFVLSEPEAEEVKRVRR